MLAQKGGNDGWYWEAGAICLPDDLRPGSSGTGLDPFTLRLFQEPDDD